jgi:hypothetical protein
MSNTAFLVSDRLMKLILSKQSPSCGVWPNSKPQPGVKPGAHQQNRAKTPSGGTRMWGLGPALPPHHGTRRRLPRINIPRFRATAHCKPVFHGISFWCTSSRRACLNCSRFGPKSDRNRLSICTDHHRP